MRERLTASEYRELKTLEKGWRDYWNIRSPETKTPMLAILFCNDQIIGQLVDQGRLIKTPPRETWRMQAYKPVEEIVRHMTSKELLVAENEFWETVHTKKYAKMVNIWIEDKDGAEFFDHLDGPRLSAKDETTAPFSPRMRKVYFKIIHEALLREIQNRQLSDKTLPPPDFTYPEHLIDTYARQYKELGKEWKYKDQRDTIEVFFTSPDPKYLKQIREPFPFPAQPI